MSDVAHEGLFDYDSEEAADGEGGAPLIKRVFHDSLFESGITVRHRPNTGRKWGTRGGLANDVVTSYVEHAFLAWLLHTHYAVGILAIPDDAHCRDGEVDAEVFFEYEPDIDEFLLSDFAPDAPPSQGRDSAQRFIEAEEENARRKQEAKSICDGCPFSLECLTQSVVSSIQHGVWGGLDADERHVMINRFNSMRRSYEYDTMPAGMRRDMESRARQIAKDLARAARRERDTVEVS